MMQNEDKPSTDASSSSFSTTSSAKSERLASEVSTALTQLAAATAVADLEGGNTSADGNEASATDTLISTMASSVISQVDAETSLSIAKKGGRYCWSKIRASLTRQNFVDTFGRNGSLRRVCLQAVNCRKFSRPNGTGDWSRRITTNFPHFKSLYLAFTILWTVWSLISNLWIMSGCILLVLGWYFFTPLATLLCKMKNPTAVQKFTVMVPISIAVAFVTGIISKAIELTVVCVVFAVAHASFHEGVQSLPLTQDEDEIAIADEVPMAVLASGASSALDGGFSGDIEKGVVERSAGDDESDEISETSDEEEQ